MVVRAKLKKVCLGGVEVAAWVGGEAMGGGGGLLEGIEVLPGQVVRHKGGYYRGKAIHTAVLYRPGIETRLAVGIAIHDMGLQGGSNNGSDMAVGSRIHSRAHTQKHTSIHLLHP